MSLANISVNPRTPGHLRSSWLKRLPDSDNDSDEGASSAKVPRYSWYVTLESESPQPTDEDEESVYSIQGKETDYVADTSDTSTHTWVSSSDSGDLSLHVEYEVASLSEGPNPFDNDSSSSGGSDIVAMGVLAFCDSDLGLADDSNDSRSSVDSEIGTADYWTCIQCNTKNNNPLFRYCEKCYQIRKNFFPPRPKWRKRRGQIESGKANCESRLFEKIAMKQELVSADSGLGSSQESKYSLTLDLNLDAITVPNSGTGSVSLSSLSSSSSSPSPPPSLPDSGNVTEVKSEMTEPAIESSETNTSDRHAISTIKKSESQVEKAADCITSVDESSAKDATFVESKTPKYRDKTTEATNAVVTAKGESDNKLCITCTAAPKNGAFVHGAVTHICCCYRCAVKVWTKTKRCPICNRKVTNVLKAFYT